MLSCRAPLAVMVLPALALLWACDGSSTSVLERENLFRLEIGRLEDQLDLFAIDGVLPPEKNRVVMRDGLFFVSNGVSNKIMVFNSYGDLLSLYYRPDANPEPVSLAIVDDADGAESTRFAVPYPFRRTGEIAVDRNKSIAIVDRLSIERTVDDTELGVRLDNVVLRFDDNGRFIDYLGQEGVGGTPFPVIDAMRYNAFDELTVVCTTTRSRIVYVYTAEGDLMYRAEIRFDRLPVPAPDSDDVAVLDEVVPGYDRREVFLKVSYFRPSIDDQTGKQYGIYFDHARIYWINLDTGLYEGYVTIPDANDAQYELLGVARNDQMFLAARTEEGATELVILNAEGRVVRRRTLDIDEIDLVQRQLHLDASGILSAMLVYSDRVELSWWRTDRLLQRGIGFDRNQ